MPVLGTDTTEDFLQAFVDGITDQEWRALQELPPIRRVTELVGTVIELRRLLDRELPTGHPLAAQEVKV